MKLRSDEVLCLRSGRDDIDLASGWLLDDGSTNRTLKGQSFRLSEQTLVVLREMWNPKRSRVFAYVSLAEIRRHFDQKRKASGVSLTRRKGMNKFHAIRRTAATLICQNAGLEAAASLIGHTSAEVTRRNYVDTRQFRHDATGVLPSLTVG